MGIFKDTRDYRRRREAMMQDVLASSPQVRESLRQQREAKWDAEDCKRSVIKGGVIGGVLGGPTGAIIGGMAGKAGHDAKKKRY